MIELALPEGWVEASFDDALENISNGVGGKQSQDGVGIPVSRIETIANESFDFNRIGFIEEPDKKDVSKYLLNVGDILFSHINSAKHLGKTAVFKNGELYHGINLLRLEVDKRITTPKYFNYYCNYLRSNGYFSLNAKHAVNQASINQKALKVAPITFPSLNEQREIVRLLSTHITTVSQIQARLDAIPKILEKFRQSVLNDAVSGELTEEWRLANTYKIEGKNLLKDSEKYWSIPKQWGWSQLGEHVKLINGDRGKNYPNKSEYVEEGIPFINTGHITTNGFLNTKKMNYISKEKFDSLSGGKIYEGDLVYCLRGATMGKTARVSPHKVGAIASSLVIVRPLDDVLTDYLYYFLVSPNAKELIKIFDNGSAQPNLSAKSLSLYSFPLPSLEEQERIVKQVNQLFAHADQIEKSVTTVKARVDHLTQSILHQAFTGNLTKEWREQNPELITGDNSAEALLARIKAEKQGSSKKVKKA